jgi:acetyl esterase/lipase
VTHIPEITAADRVSGAVARSLHKLPGPLKPRLSGGRPVVVDGLTLDPDVQLMLAARELAGEPELHDLSVAEARTSYRRQFGSIAPAPERVYDVQDLTIPGAAGDIPARWYTPPPREEGLPLLVHLHGGGHVVGDADTSDTASRMVVHHGEVAVLAVDYRMGPEYPFPAAFEDAFAAFRWAHAEAERLGVDPGRIAVGGDSAGGNLGTAVAQAARGDGGPAPAFQWLIYPVVDLTSRRPSFDLFGEGFLLTERQIDWFNGNYLVGGDLSDVRASPGLAEDLSGLPPAYVATGGFDPLRDEGEEYAGRMRAAGVPTALQRFETLPHAFANLTAISPAARDAMLQAVGALRVGLAPRGR